MQALLRKIRQILKDRRTRKFFTRIVSSVAAIVVFVTTYALILPAITLEKKAVCGIEAHQHDGSCYEERLVCGQEESDGHHHDDSCYTTKLELTCGIQEHQHSEEKGCYDADGNLVCQLQEHAHADSCYGEVRTLACGLEESEGHHHTDSCYEKVLICGKEVHIHSDKCYEEDGSKEASADRNSDGTTSNPSGAGNTDNTKKAVPGVSDSDEAAEEKQSDSYVPELEPVDMDAMLNSHTDFYFYHAEEGEEVPADSAEIADWKKVEEETGLTSTDLVKMYLAYTIPAGSLNATNPTARYRLPSNLHLSDEQIKAMNRYENGIVAGYRDSSSASDASDMGEEDKENEYYQKYLGAEAVEGNRRPDEQLKEGAQEYISAVVRAENIYDDNGEFLGQDLIFTFVPYSIEKNRNTYDADKTLVSAGEKITGWFACDFSLDQIDWEQEKSARVTFVEEDQKKEIEEIVRVLRTAEEIGDASSNETMTDVPEETDEDQDDQVFKAGTLTFEGDDYSITLEYDEEAKIPENASLSVREITAETDKEAYESCLEQAGQQVAADDKTSVDQEASRFFDIEILVTETDSDGTEKTVKIEPSAPVSVNIKINEKPASLENESDQNEPTILHFAEEGVEQIDSTITDSQDGHAEEQKTEIQFEAESFSVYGVVYTVDFHYEVDGKTYDFSITGGDGISFSNLVEILGVVDDARSFINSVENIEFSNSELVSTSKAEEDITVGQIKEKLGLECEYSAELTEKEINKINSKEIHAGDWTLISLKPFTSEETLTVTMTNGEQFTIKVTDAQLKKTVIDAKGDTWEITVTYGKDAQIPDGAELRVHEITEATEHEAYVTKTQEVLGREIDDSNDRFFDISIIDKDGNEIQPAAKVSVEIHLLDTEIVESMQVVHFGETPELMEVEHDPVSLNFLTDGFSVFAVVVVESEEGSYVFHGEGYTVTITHTAEAKIPLGTILTVEEIDPESDEYIQRLGQAWYEVNQEYFKVEEMRKNYNEGIGDLPELPLINLDHARFFNISLMYENEEIEPEVPVQVEIAYDDGMTMTGEAVSGVVHYMKDAVELIDEVNTVTEGSNVLAFKYEQANISDTGTYVGQKTYDEVAEPVVLPAPEPMQYPMLQKKAATLRELKTAGNGEDKEEAKGEKKGEDADLTAPIATKTLTPNKAGNVNDGTYTLELAVDGRAKSSTMTEIKKSNVLIVMDRSSSMINNIATNDVTQVAWYSYGGFMQPRAGYYQAGGNSPWTPTEGVTYYGQIYSNGQNRFRELFYNNGQFYYYDSQGVTTATTTSYTGNIYTSKTRTRLDEEQEALDRLIYDLLAKNGEGATDEGVSLEDIIEISVISFAKDRMDENDGAPHPSSEQDWSTEYNDLIEAVNDQYAPSGTNWDQALRYAMDKINEKKQDPTQAGEDYYLVFLTDGEPTATMNEHSGAVYYGSTAADYMPAYEAARNYVRDKSGIAEAEDIHFYGIMTWATNNIMRDFLKRLVNVGNGNVDNETDYTTEAVDEDGVDDYYYDADSLTKLEEAFNNIFNLISNNIAYEQVSITDGLTTDAMTTTLVNGSASGFQYTVYKDRVVNAEGKIVSQGTPVYTVTATDGEGGEPNVSFYIDGHEYTGNDVQKKTHEYNELQDDGTTLVPKTKYYYSVTVGEGENAHEYKMTLAEKTGDTLSWDLAAIGALEDGYTYAVSFTVWPDQDAYDYVAALNNGLKKIKDSNGQEIEVKWNTSVETDENKVTDSNGKSYWKGGALPAYPSIIKYTDGTYAVLTNTDQSLKYTIVKTETVNGEPTVVYDGPYNPDLPTPDPMPLTGTASQLEKVWNINRDPSILYKYLYESRDEEGKPVAFDIGFEIDRDGEIYKEIHLPGTATVTDDDVSYDWSAYESEDLVEYNGKTFSKRWSQDFSIATGLMLSEAQMDARNLDKSLYDDKKFFFGNTWYYILESGHDFKISEPAVGYEFDFEEPTYHPMLVDGVLMDVKFTTEDGTKRISGMKALEIDTPTGKSALTVFNTLRGYINVKKKVVDYDGTTGLTTDNTEFTFEVELTNAMPVFEGDHIPWYGINGLYYHDVDADDDYYQAEYINGKLQVTTEEGGPYEGVGTTFNPDYAGEQTITYLVDGQPVSVKICGNQMTPAEGNDTDGYKKVTGTAKITQTETLYIANVPVNTHYTIKETGLAALGYQLIDIQRQVGTNDPAPGAGNIENGIEGEIVQNTETLVTYTNKCLVTNITIQKTDVDGKGLEGAVFRLVKVGQDGHSESDASLIESVSGLTTVSKTVNEETKTYSSAFESNGEAQTINGLPDGTYRLYEVYVPAGYISTAKYIQFEIENRVMKNVKTDTSDTNAFDFTAAGNNSLALLKIKNTPGAALPNTGGSGTKFFTILGSILTLGAGLLLAMKRKKYMM